MKILDQRFDDLAIGAEASFEVDISREEVARFADLSGDRNPLHVRDGVSHGMLLASYFSRLVGMYLPGRRALYLSQDLRFIKTVNAGDRILVKGSVIAKSQASRIITLKTQIYNQSNELVVDGKGEVLVREETVTEKKSDFKMSSKIDLSGKVALITGASRGIGAAAARLLSQNGARVAVNYQQDEEGARGLIAQIEENGKEGIAVKADVSNPGAVEEMIQRIQKKFGAIDILINNAAPSFKPVSFQSLTWQEVEKQFNVVVRGAFLCAKAAVPSMMERKNGKIINIASTYAFGIPPAQLTHYVVGKSALAGFSRSLAVELGPMGIQVNLVVPGMTETALIDHVPSRFRDLYAYQSPLRRLAKPEDVAKTILFLCSDLADFITGAAIPVCGGYWMG
ncbi:MAG: SDR family oxidoreductase [Candidatus Omnitrophica bacterium]|nr:SDR family oxidoreductase [Candidatus Omnitrophota bacterium]